MSAGKKLAREKFKEKAREQKKNNCFIAFLLTKVFKNSKFDRIFANVSSKNFERSKNALCRNHNQIFKRSNFGKKQIVTTNNVDEKRKSG